MSTFFTSDLHLSHRLVSGLRGFWRIDQDGVKVPDTESHDTALQLNWLWQVQPEDTVWVLGDLSINSGPQVVEILKDLPGHKHLVSGNHDKSHTVIGGKRAPAKIEEWSQIFESIQDEAIIEIAGKKVTMSHFPFWSMGDGARAAADGYVSRYEKLRPWEGEDTILLYGHIHDPVREQGRTMHVGLDGWDLRLVPMETIEAWVRTLD
jgi:calcineurin-like phosphoesterase family protein